MKRLLGREESTGVSERVVAQVGKRQVADAQAIILAQGANGIAKLVGTVIVVRCDCIQQ